LIWKSFMENALPYLGAEPEPFESPPSMYSASRIVVNRGGRLMLDNGLCRNVKEVVYFADFGPSRTANCKENEVDVPRVIGMTLEQAEARLAAQPLSTRVVYDRAKPRQRVDIVVGQRPANGTLSSFDEVTLVLVKAVHGVVPDVVDERLGPARTRLRKRKLRLKIVRVPGEPGVVISQRPPGGVAAAPGMLVTLSVGRGSSTAIR
jgi:hypothetical protein